MANITEILGTDSVSSSRPIINSNFELLNDELASVTALLNPTTLTLSGLASVSTAALTVAQGGVNLLTVNNLGATFNAAAVFGSSLNMGGSLIKSGVLGSAAVPTVQNAPTTITATTYFVDANFTLPTAVDGQEITVINVTSDAKSILGSTPRSIALDSVGSTVTLRCFNTVWYVISSHMATIV